MATTPTPDPLIASLDAATQGKTFLTLPEVAEILAMPSATAVRDRISRGTLPLRAYKPGGATSPLVVPVVDLYALFGLVWRPVSHDQA